MSGTIPGLGARTSFLISLPAGPTQQTSASTLARFVSAMETWGVEVMPERPVKGWLAGTNGSGEASSRGRIVTAPAAGSTGRAPTWYPWHFRAKVAKGGRPALTFPRGGIGYDFP